MKKLFQLMPHRIICCAICLALTGTAVFAASSDTDAKNDAVIKDGKITSLSLDPKSGNTTVVITLGTLTLPEPKQGKPGDMQPPSDNQKQPPADSADKGKMPDIIKLSSETADLLVTKEVKLQRGMPAPAKNDGKMMMPQGNPPEGRNGNGGKDMPQDQMVCVSDLKIGDVIEVTYAKDGKSVDSILVISPFPPAGPERGPARMMGMRGRRRFDGNNNECCYRRRWTSEDDFPPPMPPEDDQMIDE